MRPVETDGVALRPPADAVTPPAGQPALAFGSQTVLQPAQRAALDAFNGQLKAKLSEVEAQGAIAAVEKEILRGGPAKLEQNLKLLEQMSKRPDFVERVKAIQAFAEHPLSSELHPGLDALLNDRTAPASIEAVRKLLDLLQMKALLQSGDAASQAGGSKCHQRCCARSEIARESFRHQ